ncbi:MAG: PAS domain-containing protein [Chlorobi bacterium]|nr:PAS domain-containing protein [Chlorobiota bacterium]
MGKAEQSKQFTLDTNLYRRFCDVACEPILVFQVPEGRLVHCNEAACDVFGATSDQLLNRTDDDLFADFRLKDVINGRGKTAERRYTGTVNIKRDDGVVVLARSRGEVMELEKDRLFFMSLHPVAREEYSEGRLQTVLEEMSIILENIRDSVCLTDTGGNIVFANPAFSNMVHHPLADVLGTTVFSLFPESLRGNIEQPFRRLVSDPEEEPVEIVLESEPENIFLEIRIESIHTEAGNHYLLFVFHDFWLLRKEAQRGAVSEDWFQYIFRGAPHGLVLFNEAGRLIDINKRALEMLNLPDARTAISAELFNTSDPEILDLGKADADTVVKKVFEGGAKEFPLPAKFKGKKVFRLRYQPILHKSGRRSIVLSISERAPEKASEDARGADVSRVVSSVPDVVYRLDVKRNAFEFLSSSVLRQTGFTVEEFSLDPTAILKDQVPEEDFRFLSHTIQQHLANRLWASRSGIPVPQERRRGHLDKRRQVVRV